MLQSMVWKEWVGKIILAKHMSLQPCPPGLWLRTSDHKTPGSVRNSPPLASRAAGGLLQALWEDLHSTGLLALNLSVESLWEHDES